MNVLLLAATGAEPEFAAWRTALVREGVPHDAIALCDGASRSALKEGLERIRFQAVILVTSQLLEHSLTAAERRALERYELEFGVRRLIAYAYPGPRVGLHAPAWAGPLKEVQATLTQSGCVVFPYLREKVPIDPGSWGYLATPLDGDRFETLLCGPHGSVLVGVHRPGDGREEMVQTFASHAGQIQSQLLRHGQLAWVARGTYLGHQRNYLSLHVDDVLLPNHGWNLATHRTDRGQAAQIRMTADDAALAARWSRSRAVRLDLVCNGAGSDRYATETGSGADPLLDALIRERDAFGWINHTYDHINLDATSAAVIEAEIGRNERWARDAGIELEAGVLVTGEHTGLGDLAADPPRGGNPMLAPALQTRGIRFLACDASRGYPANGRDPSGPQWPPGAPFMVGAALAVPRYPSSMPHDAATWEQVVDRRSRDPSAAGPISRHQLYAAEVRRILAATMNNDPRPHYFHQSNLTGGGGVGSRSGGLLYAVIDGVLEDYRRWIAPSAPLAQPTLREIGELLLRWMAWRSALASGSVTAHRQGSRVTVVNHARAAVAVPVTGTVIGSRYGGTRSGWARAIPGATELAIESLAGE